MLSAIVKLRKELHRYPELSGDEFDTVKRIKTFVGSSPSLNIIEGIGGHGLAVVHTFAQDGPTVMIRCELDALPIPEKNDFHHQSNHPGVSHKCGHDGHMAIVAGLSVWLTTQQFTTGKVVLLFQPAEETGKGAYEVLHDPKFISLSPDYIFALHNIPGAPAHSILTTNNNFFSATVQSMAIYLTGKESHASEPEHGKNPALALSEIITAFSRSDRHDPENELFSILTPIHFQMGQKNYGISPASGEIHFTLRTWTTDVMEALKLQLGTEVAAICNRHQLEFELAWFEYFPTVNNDPFCNALIAQSAKMNGFHCISRPYPFKFGEDFGWLSQHYKGAMFGLGAGIECHALHHAEYDFPDAILKTGLKMFQTIITSCLDQHSRVNSSAGNCIKN